MIEIEITKEIITSVLKSIWFILIIFTLGFLSCLGVMITVWFLPHLKEKAHSINLIRKFRKDIKMSEIECMVKCCKYFDDGKCEKDIVNINIEGNCGSFTRK